MKNASLTNDEMDIDNEPYKEEKKSADTRLAENPTSLNITDNKNDQLLTMWDDLIAKTVSHLGIDYEKLLNTKVDNIRQILLRANHFSTIIVQEVHSEPSTPNNYDYETIHKSLLYFSTTVGFARGNKDINTSTWFQFDLQTNKFNEEQERIRDFDTLLNDFSIRQQLP